MSDEKDKPLQQHWAGVRSSVNGTSFLRSGFAIFLFGQLITGLAGAAVLLLTVGGLRERFNRLSERVALTEANQKRMDEQGTNYSHYNILSDDKRMLSIETRLASAEGVIKKIDVMDEKITRIDESVKDIRAQLGRRP